MASTDTTSTTTQAQPKKLDINSVKLADLDGKYVAYKPLNASGDLYFDGNTGYHEIFIIKGDKAFEITLESDGKLYQNDEPVVFLDKAKVNKVDEKGEPVVDEDGFPVQEEKDAVYYNAKSNVENPYVVDPNLQWNLIVGTDDHAKGVALVQGLKLYIQSLNYFAFEPALASEAFILEHIHDLEEELPLKSTFKSGGESPEKTTTTTTKKKTTTSTTTTTTTVKADATELNVSNVTDKSADVTGA